MHNPADLPKTGEVAACRPRGRPRAFDRAEALTRAMMLFWRKGYEATSISDLTEAMGISSPSLYAAFGSKEALFTEALAHYGDNYSALVWNRFSSAETAREAVMSFLLDSAAALTGAAGAALTGAAGDLPRGCMVSLASVDDESYAALGKRLCSMRAATLERLEERLVRAAAAGEFPASVDIRALSRFVQTVQNGMSLLARDGVPHAELEAVARLAMAGFDARVGNHG